MESRSSSTPAIAGPGSLAEVRRRVLEHNLVVDNFEPSFVFDLGMDQSQKPCYSGVLFCVGYNHLSMARSEPSGLTNRRQSNCAQLTNTSPGTIWLRVATLVRRCWDDEVAL